MSNLAPTYSLAATPSSRISLIQSTILYDLPLQEGIMEPSPSHVRHMRGGLDETTHGSPTGELSGHTVPSTVCSSTGPRTDSHREVIAPKRERKSRRNQIKQPLVTPGVAGIMEASELEPRIGHHPKDLARRNRDKSRHRAPNFKLTREKAREKRYNKVMSKTKGWSCGHSTSPCAIDDELGPPLGRTEEREFLECDKYGNLTPIRRRRSCAAVMTSICTLGFYASSKSKGPNRGPGSHGPKSNAGMAIHVSTATGIDAPHHCQRQHGHLGKKPMTEAGRRRFEEKKAVAVAAGTWKFKEEKGTDKPSVILDESKLVYIPCGKFICNEPTHYHTMFDQLSNTQASSEINSVPKDDSPVVAVARAHNSIKANNGGAGDKVLSANIMNSGCISPSSPYDDCPDGVSDIESEGDSDNEDISAEADNTCLVLDDRSISVISQVAVAPPIPKGPMKGKFGAMLTTPAAVAWLAQNKAPGVGPSVTSIGATATSSTTTSGSATVVAPPVTGGMAIASVAPVTVPLVPIVVAPPMVVAMPAAAPANDDWFAGFLASVMAVLTTLVVVVVWALPVVPLIVVAMGYVLVWCKRLVNPPPRKSVVTTGPEYASIVSNITDKMQTMLLRGSADSMADTGAIINAGAQISRFSRLRDQVSEDGPSAAEVVMDIYAKVHEATSRDGITERFKAHKLATVFTPLFFFTALLRSSVYSIVPTMMLPEPSKVYWREARADSCIVAYSMAHLVYRVLDCIGALLFATLEEIAKVGAVGAFYFLSQCLIQQCGLTNGSFDPILVRQEGVIGAVARWQASTPLVLRWWWRVLGTVNGVTYGLIDYCHVLTHGPEHRAWYYLVADANRSAVGVITAAKDTWFAHYHQDWFVPIYNVIVPDTYLSQGAKIYILGIACVLVYIARREGCVKALKHVVITGAPWIVALCSMRTPSIAEVVTIPPLEPHPWAGFSSLMSVFVLMVLLQQLMQHRFLLRFFGATIHHCRYVLLIVLPYVSLLSSVDAHTYLATAAIVACGVFGPTRRAMTGVVGQVVGLVWSIIGYAPLLVAWGYLYYVTIATEEFVPAPKIPLEEQLQALNYILCTVPAAYCLLVSICIHTIHNVCVGSDDWLSMYHDNVCLEELDEDKGYIKQPKLPAKLNVQWGDHACKAGHGAEGFYGIAGYDPIVYRSCSCNRKVSIEGRVFKHLPSHDTPDAIATKWAGMRYLVDHFRGHVGSVWRPYPFELWVASYKPERKALLKKIKADFDMHQSNLHEASSFVKAEISFAVKDPRLVQGCPPAFNVLVGPHTRKLAHTFHHRMAPTNAADIRERGKHFYYTCGMSSEDVGKAFSDSIDHIESMCDKGEKLVFVEDDQSRFDMHILEPQFGFIDAYYQRTLPKRIANLLQRTKGMKGKMGNFFSQTKYKVDFTMQSGMPDTSLADTVLNAAMKAQIHGLGRKWVSIICGDDSVTVTTDRELARLGGFAGIKEEYKQMGMEVTGSAGSDPYDVEFCSGRFIENGGSWILMPKPGRLLAKLCWSVRSRGKRYNEWVRAIATTLHSFGTYDPIYAHLYSNVARNFDLHGPAVNLEWQPYKILPSGGSLDMSGVYSYYSHHYGLSSAEYHDLCRHFETVPLDAMDANVTVRTLADKDLGSRDY